MCLKSTGTRFDSAGFRQTMVRKRVADELQFLSRNSLLSLSEGLASVSAVAKPNR